MSPCDQIEEIVDDLLAVIPLKEQVLIANMDEIDIAVLQNVLGSYIKAMAGKDEDVEGDKVFKRLWERLQRSHKLRLIK